MLYVLSLVLVVFGVCFLAVVIFRVARVLRRFDRAASMVVADTTDRTGLLRARAAALRVAMTQRRGDLDEVLVSEQG
ncbi:bacteriophage holin [Amycolatopsis aidingensis]|uniref:bacteriophage holin n=1 Tax=Amycolatopsis aidingensis TaxID=2842453 RepID=UPI001C0A9AFF|nr:bacteriophage holin [Amycolatopsis aidingensis]